MDERLLLRSTAALLLWYGEKRNYLVHKISVFFLEHEIWTVRTQKVGRHCKQKFTWPSNKKYPWKILPILSTECFRNTEQWVPTNVPSNFFYSCADMLVLWTENFYTTWRLLGTLKDFFCNMHNNIYKNNWKIPAARQQFTARGSISVTARPRSRAAYREHWSELQKNMCIDKYQKVSYAMWRHAVRLDSM
jgi:hypothetical protein